MQDGPGQIEDPAQRRRVDRLDPQQRRIDERNVGRLHGCHRLHVRAMAREDLTHRVRHDLMPM